jgi:hypothetical protein
MDDQTAKKKDIKQKLEFVGMDQAPAWGTLATETDH